MQLFTEEEEFFRELRDFVMLFQIGSLYLLKVDLELSE